MQQIKKTLWFYLTHSYVTLISIIVFMIVIMALQIIMPGNSGAPEKITYFMIMTSAVMSSFVGIYFAGGMFKLKQFYLWQINPEYRNVLISSFLLAITVFCIIQITVMSINMPPNPFLYSVPFCAAIFSAYSVLGKTMWHKIIIPLSPILVAQVYRLGVPPSLIFLLIILAACGLLYYLYEVDTDKVKSSKEVLQEVGLGTRTEAPVVLAKINFLIGKHLSPLIAKSKKDLGWALAFPYIKISLFPLAYLLLIVPVAFMGEQKGKSVIDIFAMMLTASIVITVFGESRRLIPQLKFFSHIFDGFNHEELKSNILKTVDKIIFQNCFVFVTAIVLLCELLRIDYNFQLVVGQFAMVVLVGFACSPAFLSLKWINVSFALVFSLTFYFALVIGALVWLGDRSPSEWISIYPLGFLLLLAMVRKFSSAYFYRLSIERLMVVK